MGGSQGDAGRQSPTRRGPDRGQPPCGPMHLTAMARRGRVEQIVGRLDALTRRGPSEEGTAQPGSARRAGQVAQCAATPRVDGSNQQDSREHVITDGCQSAASPLQSTECRSQVAATHVFGDRPPHSGQIEITASAADAVPNERAEREPVRQSGRPARAALNVDTQ